HHISFALEVTDEFLCDRAGFVPVSCIKCRLAATGLFGIIMHFAAQFLQHLHHVHPRVGIKLVNKAGYKQLYFYLLAHRFCYLLLRVNCIIFSAVIAASSPLCPCWPPSRSQACSIVSSVSTPNITGMGRVTFKWVIPSVTALHT